MICMDLPTFPEMRNNPHINGLCDGMKSVKTFFGSKKAFRPLSHLCKLKVVRLIFFLFFFSHNFAAT